MLLFSLKKKFNELQWLQVAVAAETNKKVLVLFLVVGRRHSDDGENLSK